ncbi:recombination-associated protein RdgC [Ideonella sp. B7]|uniref:recombination-associated protein RdgC n=1 Tax=Ideonella benzenivorans TaxID=2831643 RepID=UPI001CEC2476|nr:recombination-associated protein RdgC [Ideonella benzenivorans]MCA6216894.1 recombination-associated protein RdgC [Ideonella benzenivorans]
MFKNLIVYRIGPEWVPDLVAAEQALAKEPFVPCAPSQPLSLGWVPPRGIEHAPFIESVGGQWLVKLKIEQKMLPSSVIKRRTDEIAAQIEQTTGRKPGKKQSKELKEQAMHELLPMAFTKQGHLQAWIDPQRRLMMVDAGSTKRAEAVVTPLVKAWEHFALRPLQTRLSPAVAMAAWLTQGEAPAGFSIDRECELKSQDEMKSVVRYARHALDIDEVREHIAQGKAPTRLALTWAGRVGFTLTEQGVIRKLAFEDVVFEGRQGSADRPEEAFDTDVAIATGELCQLIPDLVEALDGELQPGELPADLAPATPAPAAAPAPAPATAPADDTPPWA